MIEEFLKVAASRQQETNEFDALVRTLTHLPVEELQKMASGCFSTGDNDGWLCKFKDTPLYTEALELEKQQLALDVQREQQEAQRSQVQEVESAQQREVWKQRDVIQLQRKMLELRLREGQLQQAEQLMPQPTSEPVAPPPMAQEPAVEAAPEVVEEPFPEEAPVAPEGKSKKPPMPELKTAAEYPLTDAGKKAIQALGGKDKTTMGLVRGLAGTLTKKGGVNRAMLLGKTASAAPDPATIPEDALDQQYDAGVAAMNKTHGPVRNAALVGGGLGLVGGGTALGALASRALKGNKYSTLGTATAGGVGALAGGIGGAYLGGNVGRAMATPEQRAAMQAAEASFAPVETAWHDRQAEREHAFDPWLKQASDKSLEEMNKEALLSAIGTGLKGIGTAASSLASTAGSSGLQAAGRQLMGGPLKGGLVRKGVNWAAKNPGAAAAIGGGALGAGALAAGGAGAVLGRATA